MTRPVAVRVLLVLGFCCAIAACADSAPDPSMEAQPDEATTGAARLLSIPGADDSAAARGEATGGFGLEWQTPDGWIAEQPASNLRFAQYRITGPGGDAQCVVFYFGPGQGGDPMANAQRWAGQFRQPDGSSSIEAMNVASLDGTNVAVNVVEVGGIYDGGMTMTDEPAQEQRDYMLLGGIAQGPDAPWFFKFTGPESTVRSQREAFVEMLRSIRQDK